MCLYVLLLLHVVCLVVVANKDSLKQVNVMIIEPSSKRQQPSMLRLEQVHGDGNEQSLTLLSSIFFVTLRPTARTMGLPAIQIIEQTTEAFLSSMLGVNNDLTNEEDFALVHIDSLSAHVHEIEFHRRNNPHDGPNMSERKRLLLLDNDEKQEGRHELEGIVETPTRFLKEEETEELDSFTTLSMSIEATFRGDLSHAPQTSDQYLDALLVFAFTSGPMATVQFRDWLSLSGNSFFHQVTAVEVALPSISSGNSNQDDEKPNHAEENDAISNPPTDKGGKTRRISNLDISFMAVSASIFLVIVAIVVTHVKKKRKTHSEQVSYFETNPHVSHGTGGRHDVTMASLPPPSLTSGSEGNISLRKFAMESSISSIHSSTSPTSLRNAFHMGLQLHDLQDSELHCHLGPIQHQDETSVIMEEGNQVFPSQWSDVDMDAPASQSVGSIDTLDVFDVGHVGQGEELKSCAEMLAKQPSRAKVALDYASNWLEWTKSIRVVENSRSGETSEETPPLSSGNGNS